MTDVERRVRALFEETMAELSRNRGFAERVRKALDGDHERQRPPRRSGRRAPGVLDPFSVYSEGEEELRRRLGELDVEQLKDIVAEHGMDNARLAMKWRSPGRLIDLIVDTIALRARKGDAFRGDA